MCLRPETSTSFTKMIKVGGSVAIFIISITPTSNELEKNKKSLFKSSEKQNLRLRLC